MFALPAGGDGRTLVVAVGSGGACNYLSMDEPTTQRDASRPVRRLGARLVAPLRVLAGATIVVVLYFGLPFENVEDRSAWAVLAVMVGCFAAVAVWQIRAILSAGNPRLRAVEALAVSVAVLLVSFATVHCVVAKSDAAAYSEAITRMDALYFSITILSTVGFGDITPVSQTARIAVSIQMLVNVLVLGVGVRILVGAVRLGRERVASERPADDVPVTP
jgi:voltage-gated potassium channel